MNTKLHAVADANGRPLSFFMTAGQVSDYTGAAALLGDLPKAHWLLGDRGKTRIGSGTLCKPRASNWRRVATRYDRCTTVFFSAIALAATVIFWL